MSVEAAIDSVIEVTVGCAANGRLNEIEYDGIGSMARPFGELLKEYEVDPANWDFVKVDTAPSINRRNRGGTSVQEVLRHKKTGEEIVRHTLYGPDGSVFAPPHFRPFLK